MSNNNVVLLVLVTLIDKLRWRTSSPPMWAKYTANLA